MSDTLPGIAPAPVPVTCSITAAPPTDRWTVEGRDQHGNPMREVYDVPRYEPVTVDAREITGIRLETVEPGNVTVGEMFAAFEAFEAFEADLDGEVSE